MRHFKRLMRMLRRIAICERLMYRDTVGRKFAPWRDLWQRAVQIEAAQFHAKLREES